MMINDTFYPLDLRTCVCFQSLQNKNLDHKRKKIDRKNKLGGWVMQPDELQVASPEKCRTPNMFDLGIQLIPCSLATMQITEGKHQESIESNTTPDPGHHIGK